MLVRASVGGPTSSFCYQAVAACRRAGSTHYGRANQTCPGLGKRAIRAVIVRSREVSVLNTYRDVDRRIGLGGAALKNAAKQTHRSGFTRLDRWQSTPDY